LITKLLYLFGRKKGQNKKLGNDEFVISRKGRKEFINTMEAGVEIKSA
jgi:hypothetical protein